MVKKAVAHDKKVGKDKALADFNAKSGPFIDRDLDVYTADMTGKVTSHGANEKLLGRDLMQLKDADGKLFIIQILDRAKRGKAGWTNDKWANPVTKEIEAKSAYCEPHDAQVVCAGADQSPRHTHETGAADAGPSEGLAAHGTGLRLAVAAAGGGVRVVLVDPGAHPAPRLRGPAAGAGPPGPPTR